MKIKPNTTVIYLTNNTELPKLDVQIRKLLRENVGNLPIISVSRKPIKLGKNICVGEVAICEANTQRMLLAGLLEADTQYALIAKDDYLYPPEYFSFTPPSDDTAYWYSNLWVLGDKYWRKDLSDAAQICNRKLWIDTIKNGLTGHRGWKPFEMNAVFSPHYPFTWTSENPTIHLKTPNSTRRFPAVLRNHLPQRGLPYWGPSESLKEKLGL